VLETQSKYVKNIIVLYVSLSSFSGQQFAIEIVMKGLSERGWNISSLKIPALERTDKIHSNLICLSVEILRILWPTLLIWCKLILSRRDLILYAGLGQSKFALLREGLPIIMSSKIKKFSGVIISLHGSNFMSWNRECFEFKIFSLVVANADKISVLGPAQYNKMISLGIPQCKLIIMDNTCLLPELTDDQVKYKHNNKLHDRLNVLFLSSLIESKGYIQFVEAIAILAKKDSCNLDVILCGKTIFNQQTDRIFTSIESVRDWLKSKTAKINASANVRIRWIEGAVGAEKQKLFTQAHIFILPTQYKTEAQPIVILESLASGCTVITTTVGEINGTVDSNTAVFLKECSPLEIANAIENLLQDTNLRIEMAIKGLNLFKERFNYIKHIDDWESIFEKYVKNLN
jgi:glycosyltransferase involved in cell wall biosynthesis